MQDQPYAPATVRSLCLAVIKFGTVTFTRHALRRMAERDIAEIDIRTCFEAVPTKV
jgi:hypothetical protein